MGESSGSVSIDIEMIPFGGKEYLVETSKGSISVFVSGDQEKPALITYPDVALNYMSCFQGLFFHPDAASLLLNRFCIYHIDAPGHEMGAAVISPDIPLPSVDDLADQVVEVLDFFGLKVVLCLGATAGAYVLALFAMKYRERVLGLILVSPLCRAPSWTEWFYNKVMLNLLYFYGMCGMLKEWLLKRYFSEELRSGTQGAESYIVQACRREVQSGAQGAESDIVQACRRLLDERQSSNVMRFLEAINQRYDLSEGLRKLHCRTLIFVGESSPFHSEALHMRTKLDGRICTLVEVPACGSLVTEEQPHAMVIPIEQFLLRCGFHRLPPHPNPIRSPSGPLSSSRTLPELPSVESLGLKLKPIKTRVQFEV